MSTTAKRAAILGHVKAARDLAAEAEAAGRDFTDEERALVKSHVDQATKLKAELDAASEGSSLMATINGIAKEVAGGAGAALAPVGASLGQRFTEAPAIKSWLTDLGDGADSGNGVGRSPLMKLERGFKDIITGGDNTFGGALIEDDFRGLADGMGALARPLTIRDLITIGETDSDVVTYARMTELTNNAAPVAEAAGVEPYVEGEGNVRGLKPQSEFRLERVSTNVVTIAHWVPATTRVLSDAAQLRTLIDAFLGYGLAEEVEDQVVAGDGTGEDFTGVLNTDGVQSQSFDTDLLVTARKAITKVRVNGRASVSAFVLHPNDNERFDLIRNNNGDFYFGGPAGMGVSTLWGRPRVESEAVPEGTMVAADWRWAVMWDRMAAGIRVFDQHADFAARNLVMILAELRAAFGIVRPPAFCLVDLGEGSGS